MTEMLTDRSSREPAPTRLRVHIRQTCLLLAVSFVLLAATQPSSVAQEPCGDPPSMEPIEFESPQVIDPVRSGGDPTVFALADGTLLNASHAGTTLVFAPNMPDPDLVTPHHGATYLWRSADGGSTWSYVGLQGTGVGPHSPVNGFSNPDLTTDAAGNAYTVGVNRASAFVSRSTDSGRTWLGLPATLPEVDRPWIAADQTDVLYLVADHLSLGRRLWKSKDGGLTFDMAASVELPGSGPPSKPLVDPADGRLYVAVGKSSSSDPGTVAIYPHARADVFDDYRIISEVSAGTPYHNGPAGIPMALDAAGNVYLVSNTEDQIWVSHSTDRGLTWTTTVVRATSGNSVIWPWISAGDEGRVAVSWYEADRNIYGGPTGLLPAKWRVHVAYTGTGSGWVDNCGAARPPSWETTVATPEPFHDGVVCFGGTGCQVPPTDRRLGDYHTNTITPDGRLVIAYADTSLRPDGAIAHPGIVRQSGGLDFGSSRAAEPPARPPQLGEIRRVRGESAL